MSSPLVDVWEAAASSPFSPAVGKNTQFTVGFVLLAICMLEALLLSGPLLTTRAALILTTIFGLSTRHSHAPLANPTHAHTDRSFINLPVLGVPASLAFGYVASETQLQHAPTDCKQLRRRLHDLRSRRIRLVSYFSIRR